MARSTYHSRAVGAMALSAAIGGEISSTTDEVTREHGVCHIHCVACLNSKPKHWRRYEGIAEFVAGSAPCDLEISAEPARSDKD